MTYATDHAGALADIQAAGAAVTFSIASKTYDAATDTWSSVTTASVAGAAVRVRGDPKVYAALGLVESEAPTLLFAPSTYGGVPALGSSVTWNGTAYTVKQTNPVAPDGTAIVARVVVAA